MFDYGYSGDYGVAYAQGENCESPVFEDGESEDVYAPSEYSANVFGEHDETSVPFFPSVQVKEEPMNSPPIAGTNETENENETEAPADSGAASPNTTSASPSDSYVQFPNYNTPVEPADGVYGTCFPAAANNTLMVPNKRARSSSTHRMTSAPVSTTRASVSVSEPTDKDIEELFHKSSAEVEEYARTLEEAGKLTPELDSKIRHVCRQVKNRESAQLSRMRKRQYVTALSSALEKERNEAASAKIAAESATAERDYERNVSQIWRSYAESLRQALIENRGNAMDIPPMPEIPVFIPPKITKPTQTNQETFFSGPSGFGHLSRAKRH